MSQNHSFHPALPLALWALGFSSCEKKPTLTPLKTKEIPAVRVEHGMARIEGGSYIMGSSGLFQTEYGPKEFPEERPPHEVSVNGFWIDQTEVTNAQFAAFVKATGYVTFAEREAKLEDFPEEARASLPVFPFKQGCIVFIPHSNTQGNPNEPGSYMNWWRWDPEANWRAPMGKGSSIEGLDNHPVVCVNHDDALAYAKWAGKRLPTEAEWEYAARGGHEAKMYIWGDVQQPGDKPLCNHWQGKFPNENTAADGYESSAPVKSYPPNDFQLYDMAGNVWEMCSDYYDPKYFQVSPQDNPKGPEVWVNRESGVKGQDPAHYVCKGGSFLCHESYCLRFRPGARHSGDIQSPTNHTGFRCVKDL
jgi:formylglycine-generating enzyme